MGSLSDLLLFAGQGKEVEIRLILGVLSNRTHSLFSLFPADEKERINRILFFAHSSRRDSFFLQAASFILSFLCAHGKGRRRKRRRGAGISPTDTCCDRDEDDGDERVRTESDVFIDASTAEKV